eukprot:9890209-Heterocapsa_arctica.AAC.2
MRSVHARTSLNSTAAATAESKHCAQSCRAPLGTWRFSRPLDTQTSAKDGQPSGNGRPATGGTGRTRAGRQRGHT